MVIDIISYTPEQFATLNEEQILKIQSAQLKKNRLQADLQEKLAKEKFRLVKNGTFISTTWNAIEDEYDEEYAREVENIREGLLFYLQYCAKPEGTENAPYAVDYSLDLNARLEIVKTYYEDAYSDPTERAREYKKDEVARSYLGEYFSPLYDYFLSLQ